MSHIFSNICQTIGNTPILKLNRITSPHRNIYVKLESFNPMGSVKDRVALSIIETAERAGKLTPGQTVIEATSGNTGIGLAMVCAQKGYPLVVTMAENFSLERRRLMRYLGAKVVLTPAAEKGSGMKKKAMELAATHGWFYSDQFTHPANADVHSQTTALEILEAFPDSALDYWVSGYGTGGTLNGVARVLKSQSPKTRIVVCEPDNSPLLASNVQQEAQESHPAFRPHLMQGWTPDFIPDLVQQAVESGVIDQLIAIDGQEALDVARALATKEGIFCGISSGATVAGALQIVEQSPNGSSILCMLPDTGERYLSTPLFEHIADAMNEEELSISTSTPGYRFDAKPKTSTSSLVPISDRARSYLKQLLSESTTPILLFTLKWCEFCWSVRKLLDKCQLPYQLIELDAPELLQDNFANEIRAALTEMTGSKTIPQIFIEGEFIGGCTELFELFRNGSLKTVLEKVDCNINETWDINPDDMLPTWLHSR
jgi:cysteine synthase